jgi:hypothetical protein
VGKNAQRRRAAREAEQLAERRKIEEQFGITIKPSKPVMGGRYLRVKPGPTVRYPPPKVVRHG